MIAQILYRRGEDVLLQQLPAGKAQANLNALRVQLPLVFIVISLMGLPGYCGAQQNMVNVGLAGTRRVFPGRISAFAGNANLTRLLDVGACINSSDPFVSYVPPLDGTSPLDTLCQQGYAMKLVLFDLRLLELKAIDPSGGSFQAEIQMIFHWYDYLDQGSTEMDVDGKCKFRCDNNPQLESCCDNVWVPPLRLPGCELNAIQSSTPVPSIYTSMGNFLSLDKCIEAANENDPQCFWRRLWYLNVDATCASEMDLSYFPFDVQSLTIDVLNPYSSRTWLQLTKGLLKQKVGEGSNDVELSSKKKYSAWHLQKQKVGKGVNDLELSPMRKIWGWTLKKITLSSTCGMIEAWKETFLTQDILLSKLQDSQKGYVSQSKEILDAFSKENLKCVFIEDSFVDENKEMTNPLDMDSFTTRWEKLYAERVNYTLEHYNTCIEQNGKEFAWSKEIHSDAFLKITNNIASRFSTSDENIRRSFNLLNLQKRESTTKIWFPCAISALANLTTPGIRVTILIQRFPWYYFSKLVLPTLACVALSFTAFGLHPKELFGRLSLVAPSIIALTALQASVETPAVYTDVAPYSFLFLVSLYVQLFIATESLFMNRMWVARSSFSRLKSSGEEGVLPSTTNAATDFSGSPTIINTVEGGESRAQVGNSSPNHNIAGEEDADFRGSPAIINTKQGGQSREEVGNSRPNPGIGEEDALIT
ncbi:hypothetical protein GOP47_0030018 [Adiantum capillus-veneris]|nr:hypothetical protein GOP47_0030018 [Adiantum capillus-veneris]